MRSETLSANLANYARRRLRKIKPLETDADRVSRFANDPVAFALEVLGVEPWSKQVAILRAIVAHKRVSVVSGHKCGKSEAYAMLALWFYCTFPEGRVVIMAATDRQVNGVIWKAVRRLVRKSRIPIPGAKDIHISAEAGLDNPANGAEIRGYTAKDAEAAAGTSAPAIMYLVDEASGVKDPIFVAIEGNRAGGDAWVCLISNPTKADGEFYESHHSKSMSPDRPNGYFTLHIDSRESPNCTGEWRQLKYWDHSKNAWFNFEKPIPGLAMPEWCEEKALEWGKDSAEFKIRIAGSFVIAEAAKIFPLGLLIEAESRWEDAVGVGRLIIGVDPAGDGLAGDESAFCARRGQKIVATRAQSGMSEQAHIIAIKDLALEAGWKPGDQIPLVSVESEGMIGARVYGTLVEYAMRTQEFEVYRIRTSDAAVRQAQNYHLRRDELWGSAREWMRLGGAIPANAKLEKDLHAPEFSSDIRGRLKVTAKKDLRKILGRSPDLGDAFVLCCWEPSNMPLPASLDSISIDDRHRQIPGHQPNALDPYAAADVWV